MPITASFPAIHLDRLSRLHLATDDATQSGSLAHIHLRLTPDRLRFSATNGRILASIAVPIDSLDGVPTDVVLDAGQFTAAMKALGKAKSQAKVHLVLTTAEARFTLVHASAIVRVHAGMNYPQIDHVWSKPAGMAWIPTVSTLDTVLVATAQKISGSGKLLFSTPIPQGSPIASIFAIAPDPVASLSVRDLGGITRAAAYWADHELAILVIPVTRSADERTVNLDGFVCSMPVPVPAALAA